MTAVRNEDGTWNVVRIDQVLAGPFATMAEAWRWIDRRANQPVNRSEDVGDWAFRQSADRGRS